MDAAKGIPRLVIGIVDFALRKAGEFQLNRMVAVRIISIFTGWQAKILSTPLPAQSFDGPVRALTRRPVGQKH